jgi:hypothetical protein
MRTLILCAALFVAVLSSPAVAQDVSLLSFSRLSIATGLDYSWYRPSSTGGALLEFQKKEFEVPLNLSYNLFSSPTNKPLLSLIAGTSRGFESRVIKARVGLRLVLFTGGK